MTKNSNQGGPALNTNLNQKTMMRYCWSLLITYSEDLADQKFYVLIEPFHIIETVRTDKNLVHITLYQTVLSKKKAEKPAINARNSGDQRPIEPGNRKCEMGRLWACQCIDGNGKLRYFYLAFSFPSKFLIGKPHPAPYRPRTQF